MHNFCFIRDSDDDDKVDKTSKTTAADLFGSDIDDDSDIEKPPDSSATALATQVLIVSKIPQIYFFALLDSNWRNRVK